MRGETGPTGGPAFTDLLGVCLSWNAASCVVQPETGTAVEIALADIVSGKPVPPRPSVRQRVGVRESEARTGVLWPDLERVPLGEWEPAPRARAGGAAAQAGQLLPRGRRPGPPGGRCPRRGGRLLRRPRAGPAHPGGGRLLRRGRGAGRRLGAARPRRVRACGWPAWPSYGARWAGAARTPSSPSPASGRTQRSAPAATRSPRPRPRSTGTGSASTASPSSPGTAAAGSPATCSRSLLDWGAEQGATTVWLHVETANPGGLALWDALGLAPHHVMRYLEPVTLSVTR
ncbi:hypothetical protein G5V59_08685 [Nocardioides sp. W3-2-3]|uniref:GNAT family N-acetyltransferase, cg3035/Rv0428c family n=1 Tax=Nocardioides convexus TaxID=2712224 RepID=UPI0024187BF5|nr:hypothetical protein [Nocardioides convexus]NHA00187.1 hypothetical protein [Nocardioides convexus]